MLDIQFRTCEFLLLFSLLSVIKQRKENEIKNRFQFIIAILFPYVQFSFSFLFSVIFYCIFYVYFCAAAVYSFKRYLIELMFKQEFLSETKDDYKYEMSAVQITKSITCSDVIFLKKQLWSLCRAFMGE